jgi:hypothetical protein
VQSSMPNPDFFVGNPAPISGVIVYDKGNNNGGWRYLQMASSDLEINGSVFTGIGCSCTAISGTNNVLGGGRESTAGFVNSGCASAWLNGIAGTSIDGFSDWYIPSLAELELVFSTFQGVNSTVFNSFQSGYYWTSTPAAFGACGINGGVFQKSMINGDNISASRSNGIGRIRLMRRFSSKPSLQWSTGSTDSTLVLNHTSAGNFNLGLTVTGFNNPFTGSTISYADPVSWPQATITQLLYNYSVTTQLEIIEQQIFEGDSVYFGNQYKFDSGTYYDTTVSNEGCLQVSQLNLQVLPIPLKCRIDVSYCAGDLQKLSLFADPPDSPGNPLSIQWSTGATTPQITLAPNASGIYSVTVSDDVQSCTASIQIQNP